MLSLPVCETVKPMVSVSCAEAVVAVNADAANSMKSFSDFMSFLREYNAVTVRQSIGLRGGNLATDPQYLSMATLDAGRARPNHKRGALHVAPQKNGPLDERPMSNEAALQIASVEWTRRSEASSASGLPRWRLTISLLSAPR